MNYFKFLRSMHLVKISFLIFISIFLSSCASLIKKDVESVLFEQIQRLDKIRLPKPHVSGKLSVEKAISIRGTVKDFVSNDSLVLDEISQILWAAQGITKSWKMTRAAPSVGLTYPLELYLIIEKDGVSELRPGIYCYIPESHSLEVISFLKADIKGDSYRILPKSISVPEYILKAPVIIVITADFKRTLERFKRRGRDYVYMEAGFVGENICLQAASLGLAVSIFGEFNRRNLAKALGLPRKLEPLLIISVGHRETEKGG